LLDGGSIQRCGHLSLAEIRALQTRAVHRGGHTSPFSVGTALASGVTIVDDWSEEDLPNSGERLQLL
jgi:hypothetical protein